MNEQITLGASVLMGSLVGATWLARHYARPTGRHRGTRAPRRPATATVPLAQLLGDAPESTEYAHCPNEQIERPHLAHASGALTCTTCGHHTAGGAW